MLLSYSFDSKITIKNKFNKSLKTAPPKTAPLKIGPLKTAPLKTAPLKTAPLKTSPLKTTPLKTAPPKGLSTTRACGPSSAWRGPMLNQVIAVMRRDRGHYDQRGQAWSAVVRRGQPWSL